MDMSLREWLIVLGIIIIAAVVIDGLRRIRRARQDSKEIAEGMGGNAYHSPVEDNFNPELPSGGFRVIRKGEDSGRVGSGSVKPAGSTPDSPGETSAYSADQFKVTGDIGESSRPDSGNFSNEEWDDDANAPTLRDLATQDHPSESYPSESYPSESDPLENRPSENQPLAEGQQHQDPRPPEGQDSVSRRDPSYENSHADSFVNPPAGYATEYSTEYSAEKFSALDDEPEVPLADVPMSAIGDCQTAPPEEQSAQPRRGKSTSRSASMGDDFKERFLKKITSVNSSGGRISKSGLHSKRPARQSGDKRKEKPAGKDFDEIIVVNVLAKGEEQFDGKKLQNLLEACGMQLGEMSIYHRHEYDFDKGPIQFSMANVLPPGTFTDELEKTPGVCFFVRLPGPDESMQAFDYMIETAQCVVRNLGGELKDENHSVMTAQTIEHCRQRVREFERRQLSQRV